MLDYLNFVLIFLIGLISPGPDFLIVTKNSITYGDNKTFLTVLGISVGNIFHAVLAMTFLTLLGIYLDSYVYYLKYIGASYLVYVGIKLILDKRIPEGEKEKAKTSKSKFFLQGLMINALNVKVVIFFSSIYSLYIGTPGFDLTKKVGFAIIPFFLCLIWFSLVAKFFSSDRIRRKILSYYSLFNKILGVALIIISYNLIL